MSTSLSAHQGCVGIFRSSNPTWGPYKCRADEDTNVDRRNVYRRAFPVDPPLPVDKRGRTSTTTRRRPNLRVERNNDDFAYLAKHHHPPPGSTPNIVTTKVVLPEEPEIPKTIVSSSSHVVTPTTTTTMNDASGLSAEHHGDWVLLEDEDSMLMTDDEWDFVELRPSYADVVVRQDGDDDGFRLVRHKRSYAPQQRALPRTTKFSREGRNPGTTEFDDTRTTDESDPWSCSKYDTARAYHRKLEIKRTQRKQRATPARGSQ